MIALGWIARRPDSRIVRITEDGRRALARRFGVAAAALATDGTPPPARACR
jgi:hypothetical protein